MLNKADRVSVKCDLILVLGCGLVSVLLGLMIYIIWHVETSNPNRIPGLVFSALAFALSSFLSIGSLWEIVKTNCTRNKSRFLLLITI